MMPILIGESEDKEIKIMFADDTVWLESWNGKEICKPVPCKIDGLPKAKEGVQL